MMLPAAAVFLAMFSTVSGASLAKGLFPILGGPGTAALRIMLSAMLLAIVFRPWKARLNRQNIGAVGIYGLMLVGMNMTFYLAIARIPLGITVAVEFMGPLSVAMLGSRRALDLLWVALAIGGLALLTPWGGKGALDPVGLMLAACAGLFWALYIVFGQRASHDHGAQAVSIGMSIAGLVMLPIVLVKAPVLMTHSSALPLALAVALLSSAIPYTVEMIGLRHIPAATFGIMMSVEPAVAALVGYILLGETLTATQGIAILAVTTASAGATLTAARTPEFQEVP